MFPTGPGRKINATEKAKRLGAEASKAAAQKARRAAAHAKAVGITASKAAATKKPPIKTYNPPAKPPIKRPMRPSSSGRTKRA